MATEEFGLHLAQPAWLWALGVLVVLWLWPRARARLRASERLRRYADAALLPHLLTQGQLSARSDWRRLLVWSALWSFGVLAMAGPRWDYTDMDLYQPGSDLVILLDLSRSMNVSDVKPSRLARARQEIEDLLNAGASVRIGVVAFATVAHVVAPITDDTETIRHLLPSLTTDLVSMPGSRVSTALDRAQRLLSGQPPGSAQSMLLISDGDFAEPGLIDEVKKLRQDGLRLHVLGVGTQTGSLVPGPRGQLLQDATGRGIVSRLDEKGLQALAAAGGGVYERADFRDDDTRAILAQVVKDAPNRAIKQGRLRVWNERYYLAVVAMLLLLLPSFRRTRRAVRL